MSEAERPEAAGDQNVRQVDWEDDFYGPKSRGLNRLRAALPALDMSRIRIPLASPAFNALLVACAVIFAVVAVATHNVAERYPLAKTLVIDSGRQLMLLAANGKPFARRGGCVDAPVTLKEVPEHLVDAVLAMEDRRFYSHIGIDPLGVVRAWMANHTAGRIVQGGSTITQQLAKNAYLSNARTYDRKFEEVLVALRLEFSLSKDEILERYLNSVYFGDGCYGIRAAARHYFEKPVRALTLPEAAYLVALLRAPTRLSAERDAAQERARLVMEAMVDDGRLDAEKLKSLPPPRPRVETGDGPGAYYADWTAKTVELPKDGKLTPLPVRTAFEPELQRIAEAAVEQIMRKQGPRLNATQAALVAMRPDGRVVAMVGGLDYAKSQFNRAAQAQRQPGSAFKTFVYLAALRAGVRPDMHVPDAPISIGDWSPENYGHRYRGMVSIRQAFTASINTVAVRLSESVGRDAVIAAARDLGITAPLNPTPSLALGASEVSLLELTSAFAAVAADAYPVKPWSIVSLGPGKAGPGKPPKDAGRWRLMVGHDLRELMFSVVQYGTGRAARLPFDTFGKTGTSQDYRDAWFIGFAGNLIVGVWVGNDDFAPMRRVTGGSLPARIWQAFMNQARKADPQFTPELQQVADFKAEAKDGALLTSNESTGEGLDPNGYRLGGYYDWHGYPSLFGQARDEGRTRSRYRSYERRPSRSLRSQFQMLDGG